MTEYERQVILALLASPDLNHDNLDDITMDAIHNVNLMMEI
jgi:hypothetical protein